MSNKPFVEALLLLGNFISNLKQLEEFNGNTYDVGGLIDFIETRADYFDIICLAKENKEEVSKVYKAVGFNVTSTFDREEKAYDVRITLPTTELAPIAAAAKLIMDTLDGFLKDSLACTSLEEVVRDFLVFSQTPTKSSDFKFDVGDQTFKEVIAMVGLGFIVKIEDGYFLTFRK